MYTLTLSTTTGAPADGVQTNAANVKLMNGDTYVSGEAITFKIVSGNALFSNGTAEISSTTDSSGECTEIFTNTIAQTIVIVAMLQSDASIVSSASSEFTAADNSDDLIVSFNVMQNDAEADGSADNRLEVIVIDKVTLKPVENVTVLFQIASGSALFINGSKSFLSSTNSSGQSVASLTNTVAEHVVVTALVEETSYSETVVFLHGSTLMISRVSTITDKSFAHGQPSVAWVGAQFKITTKGGSGSISWQVDGYGLALQTSLVDGAIFQFADNVMVPQNFTITATDLDYGDKVSYVFNLTDFYIEFGSVKIIEDIVLAGDNKYLPSPEKLHTLYSQWGPMSNYGWTDTKQPWYWTSDFNILAFANLVNVDDNQERGIVDLIYLGGFAKLNVIQN